MAHLAADHSFQHCYAGGEWPSVAGIQAARGIPCFGANQALLGKYPAL